MSEPAPDLAAAASAVALARSVIETATGHLAAQGARHAIDANQIVAFDLAHSAAAVEAALVSVGNPHAVVFGERVDAARAVELGPHIERHPIFPERTNMQLVEVLDRSHARIEIWERGAGYTLASGTSASAVAAALMRDGLVDDEVTIVMPGGDLRIRKGPDGNLIQQGPAQRVYRAEIELADLERATPAT